jgi:hypothetical protein
VDVVSPPYVLPVELIYRELARPKPEDAKPASVTAVKPPPLTRADVDAIIHRQRTATPEELEEVLSIKDFKLSEFARNQISVDLTVAISQRAVSERREDPSSKLVHDLGYALTPFGLLADRAWFQKELKAATNAIAACRRHLPPQCSCWRDARASLYSIRESFGEKSPESWATLRVWEALEEIELSSRPERTGIAE